MTAVAAENDDGSNSTPPTTTITPCDENNVNTNNENNQNIAEQTLRSYLNQPDARPSSSWQRVYCCNSSRYLYCPECCTLLVPREDWPRIVQEGDFQLPFELHILLDDRRPSSTGVQLNVLAKAAASNSTATSKEGDEIEDEEEEDPTCTESKSVVKLFDMGRGETPCYYNRDDLKEGNAGSEDDDSNNHQQQQQDGVYLLFPGRNSVPLSSILQPTSTTTTTNPIIKTLVVLDCTWSGARGQLPACIAALPQVSLDHPPASNFYWRWHNTGAGMLSTIEAIYFAAWQITTRLHCWTLQEQRERLTTLLWIFRHQKNIIEEKYATHQVKGKNPHVPFTEEAKEFARNLRCREYQLSK